MKVMKRFPITLGSMAGGSPRPYAGKVVIPKATIEVEHGDVFKLIEAVRMLKKHYQGKSWDHGVEELNDILHELEGLVR